MGGTANQLQHYLWSTAGGQALKEA